MTGQHVSKRRHASADDTGFKDPSREKVSSLTRDRGRASKARRQDDMGGVLSRRGAPRDAEGSPPESPVDATERAPWREVGNDPRRFRDFKGHAASGLKREGDESREENRVSETAHDDLIGTAARSLLDLAVRRVVMDLDENQEAAERGTERADAVVDWRRSVKESFEDERTTETYGSPNSLEERIASLPPDVAQIVFEALVKTKRLVTGGVFLAKRFKYLWFVDLRALGGLVSDDVVNVVLRNNERTLLQISLAECAALTAKTFRSLCALNLENLTSLDLSECPSVTDECLACLRNAPNLETLRLEGCPLNGEGLKHCAGLRALRRLSLERCGRLGGLGERVSLESLDNTGENANALTVPHDATTTTTRDRLGASDETPPSSKKRRFETGAPGGVPGLGTLVALETLNLGWCNRVTDAEVATMLGNLVGLRTLVLARTKAGLATATSGLPNLRRLSELDLSGTPFDDAAALALIRRRGGGGGGGGGGGDDGGGDDDNTSSGNSRFQSVRSVSADGLPILPTLRALSLEATRITGRAAVGISVAFPNLMRLNVAFTNTDDEGVAILCGKLRRLTAVNLDSCSVGDPATRALASLPELRRVTLADTDVGNDGLESLARGCPELAHLDLGHTLVDDEGVEHLKTHAERLTSLSLDSRLVTDRGVARIAGLEHLETLDLFSANVTDVATLAFRNMKKLKSLEMCGGNITDVGVARVAQFCAALERLNLGQNSGVTNRGARAVSTLKHLTALNLTGSKVTDRGIKKFASLKNLTTLAIKDCVGVTSAAVSRLKRTLPRLVEVSFLDREKNLPTLAAHSQPVSITAPVVVEAHVTEPLEESAATAHPMNPGGEHGVSFFGDDEEEEVEDESSDDETDAFQSSESLENAR